MNYQILKLWNPIDIAPLVFFRIIFGILGFVDILNTFLYYHLRQKAFDPEKFQFKYYGFTWIEPLTEPWMTIVFIVLMIAALMIALGWYYRFSTLFFALGFTYTFLLEKAHYLNHGYLFCWIAFLMFFLPAHRAFSIDTIRKPGLKCQAIPAWCLYSLMMLMGIVYFYGGLAKINSDWLNAIPLKFWLAQKADIWLIGPLLSQTFMAYFMAYGGLFLDLTIAFFLLNRHTRIWALGAAIFFHGLNTIIFNIGIFPMLSLSLTLLFFPPSLFRKIYDNLKNHLPFLNDLRKKITSNKQTEEEIPLWQGGRRWKKSIKYSLIFVFGLHLLIPLRHLLFPGNVAWTEEGHRYSWRMMLRSKTGYGTFVLVNPKTKEKERVKVDALLSKKQRRKIFTHPDMILQFAHYLSQQQLKRWEQVEIYVETKVKLNGRKYQFYIDPGVNLNTKKWAFFRSSDWILPLEKN